MQREDCEDDYKESDPLTTNSPSYGAAAKRRSSDGDSDIIIPGWFCWADGEVKMNRNVFFIYVFHAVIFFGMGLASSSVEVGYVKIIARGKIESIGLIEGLRSISNLIFAIPIGVASDRFGRRPIILIGAVLGTIYQLLTLYIIYFVGTDEDALDIDNGKKAQFAVHLYMATEVLSGIFVGVIVGPLMCLFSESIAVGTSSVSFYYLHMIIMLCIVLGNFLSVLILKANGNMWILSNLRVPLYLGSIIQVTCYPLLLLLDDKYARKKNVLEEENQTLETSDVKKTDRKSSKTLLIPTLILAHDIISCLFMGLFESYFPVYMASIGMSPNFVQVVFLF